jgi:predicted helicase
MNPQGDLFAEEESAKTTQTIQRRHAITDAGLKHFQDAYSSETITKEDLFYYIYGLLHSEEYRERYADNLMKELPRIPAVKSAADFRVFSEAGRKLAELHVDYESAPLYPVEFKLSKPRAAFDAKDYYVQKMKFAKGTDSEKYDMTTVIYNHNITITDIPLAAYDYIVNGKSALEWVMERQAVTTHKESGIVNDANDWAVETMGDPAYPLKLFQRVITVSLETMKIVRSLPRIA